MNEIKKGLKCCLIIIAGLAVIMIIGEFLSLFVPAAILHEIGEMIAWFFIIAFIIACCIALYGLSF
jgi:hypothetical protein